MLPNGSEQRKWKMSPFSYFRASGAGCYVAVQRWAAVSSSQLIGVRQVEQGRIRVVSGCGRRKALSGAAGKSGLLLVRSGVELRLEVRRQRETIHGMLLKIHAGLQRLSPSAVETRLARGQAERATLGRRDSGSKAEEY